MSRSSRHRRVHLLAATSALGFCAALGTTSAQAAAIERTVPAPVRVLFEKGSYVEFGVLYTDPHQSGDGADLSSLGGPAFLPGNTGDLFEGTWNYFGAWKADINEKFSYALAFDQPYGAHTSYGAGSFPAAIFSYDGTTADLNTYQLSAILAYDATPNVKLYGGLRAQRLDARASIPFVGPTANLPGYTVSADPNWGYGYLVGAAYHRPEIALRVALTYQSKISHDLDTDELGGLPIPGVQTGSTETDVDTPQSMTLEFQTGVAANTLVFGSIRWVDWSEFAIAPPTYTLLTGRPLVDYADDWWTYNLGAGYQFTDALAGSLSVTYEPSVGGVLTTLGPYDGRAMLTGALSYDFGPANVTGGVTYGKLGNTTNLLATNFDDGSVWAFGLRYSYSF